jgi:hypothetical protein
MLDYIFNRKFPKPNEYFSYFCPLLKLNLSYNYPNKYNIPFLPMEYFSSILFKLLTPELIIDFIMKILTEHSLIFISENIKNLTGIV